MESIKLYQVDSFTDSIFKGNPAGVVLLESSISDLQMQNIASEINCSETAFLTIDSDHYNIRYFTPEVEVPLCGHATLASAYIIFNHTNIDSDKIVFHAKNDVLSVRRSDDWIYMTFPKDSFTPYQESSKIQRALRVSNSPNSMLLSKFEWIIVELESPEDVQNLSPDFQFMRDENIAIVATAKGTNSIDFVSRVFAPPVGINEDPVTGLAHSSLGVFWSERLQKYKMTGSQLSKRTGIVKIEITDTHCIIGGQAILAFDINIHGRHFA